MKITDFLCRDAATNDLKASTKEEVIAEMAGLLVEAGAIEKKHKAKIIETLMAREALGSLSLIHI